MRGILIAAASAAILSGLAAEPSNAQTFDASRFAPPSSLAKSAASYCERIAAPKPELVEYVDGYAATCDGRLSSCLRPLTQGYGFVEIELAANDFSTGALPPGSYRAEIIDAPSVQCRAFDAATLGDLLNSDLNNLRLRQKCVKLQKVDALKSKYKFVRETEYLSETGYVELPYVSFERVVRLSDGEIVAERIDSSVEISADVSISCRSPVRRGKLITTVIPPSAFAPLD